MPPRPHCPAVDRLARRSAVRRSCRRPRPAPNPPMSAVASGRATPPPPPARSRGRPPTPPPSSATGGSSARRAAVPVVGGRSAAPAACADRSTARRQAGPSHAAGVDPGGSAAPRVRPSRTGIAGWRGGPGTRRPVPAALPGATVNGINRPPTLDAARAAVPGSRDVPRPPRVRWRLPAGSPPPDRPWPQPAHSPRGALRSGPAAGR